jgi:hypothetical protein
MRKEMPVEDDHFLIKRENVPKFLSALYDTDSYVFIQ